VKIVILSLLCFLLPGIIISITSYSKAAAVVRDNGIETLGNAVSYHAHTIDTYISEILADAEDVVSNATIKQYTTEMVTGTASATLQTYADDRIKMLKSYNRDLAEVMIIGNNGEVLSSTAAYSVGAQFEGYSTIAAQPGVSGFFTSRDQNGAENPAFSVVTNIFSENNEVVGILYEVYYTDSLETIISDTNTDVSTTLALSDKDNNLIVFNYTAVTNMTSRAQDFAPFISDISEKMDDLLDDGTHSETIDPFVSETSTLRRLIAMNEIPEAGWVFISSTDYKAFISSTERSVSNIPLEVLLMVLGVAGIIFVIVYSLNPLNTVVSVLFRKSSGGDVASRIAYPDHHDELDFIRDSLNDLFERITEGDLKYETMVEMTNNIVFTIDLKHSLVEMSKNFNKKFSFRPKDNSIEESFIYKIRVHKDDKEKYLSDMDAILKEANFIDGEYRIKNLYGDFAWVMIKATKFFDRNENPSKIIGVIVDIDKDKKSKMSLLMRASYDALTQIFNRETFLKTLGETIETTMHRKDLAAVLFIDLDDFKHFNDDFSHACGDEVLKFTADTLKEISFERGFAGRFGGDEFVCCLTSLTLYSDAGNIAQEIIDIMSRGFISESTGLKLAVHCSVGISFLHESGKTTDEVVAAADAAMYNIKKHGKSAFAYAQKGDEPAPVELIPKPIDN
jgi:diguanylate cyclase (GGDEF)-like protein/PAS domain S-box-containing protein